MSETKDKHVVDVIETNIMFAVDVVVNIKVKKTTSYGNPEPKYECAEIANVCIPDDELDWSTKDHIIRNIQSEALEQVKKHEEDIMREKEE